MRVLRSFASRWLAVSLAGCASTPAPAPGTADSTYAGSFGGNTFTERSVNGPNIQLAKGETEWTGQFPCGGGNGRPPRGCLTFIRVLRPGEFPKGVAAFDDRESYDISRKGFSVLLTGPRMTYEFLPKREIEFPAELVWPLFWAVISATDPSRELKFSDPPFWMGTMSSPSSVLVWMIDIRGFGEVGIARRPSS
jgi:hypothetical protein